MALFSKETDDQKRSREADEYALVLTEMAKEEEKKLLADAPATLAKYRREHKRRVAGFSFDCKRHGDFLSIFMAQSDNAKVDWKSEHFSKTINLGLIKSISLQHGREPDRKGRTGWAVRHVYFDKDGKESGWGSSSGRPCGPPKDGKHVVKPKHDYSYQAHEFYFEENQVIGHADYYDMDGGLSYVTENTPRCAKADEIHLSGLDTTIFAPAGCGQSVLDRMLSEFAKAKRGSKA